MVKTEMFNLDDIIKHRFTYIGLSLIIALAICVFEAVNAALSIHVLLYDHILVWGLIIAFSYLAWFRYRMYFPKNKKCKFSIVVSISTETEQQRSRIIKDFMEEIDKLLSMNCLKSSLNLIVMNQHQAEIINDNISKVNSTSKSNSTEIKVLTKLMVKKRYNLVIYGNMKLRSNNENIYIFNTRVVLLGKAVDEVYAKHVSKVIGNVWLPSLRFPERMELDGVSTIANYYFICSLYLVGFAAYFSGLTEDSIVLLEKLLEQKHSPGCSILLSFDKNWFSKLDHLISDAYVQLARSSYGNNNDNSSVVQYVDKALSYAENYDALLLRAILSFNVDRNIDGAMGYILRAKAIANNNVWMYSMAFLHLYSDRHEEALRYYNNLAKSTYPDEEAIIQDVIIFIDRVLVLEPDKYILYFALGFLYYKKLKDYGKGIANLSTFLDISKNIRGSLLSRRARAYIAEMQRFGV